MYGSVLGPDGLPVAEYDVMKMRFGNRLDVARMFPPAFTLSLCLLYLVPTFLLIYVNRNPVVSYFNSSWVYLLLLIPVIIACVHVRHQRKQAPCKHSVICALFVPSLLLFFFANNTVQQASSMNNKLLSTDCDTFKTKELLQLSWENAYTAFMTCVNQTNYAGGVPQDLLMQNFRLEDCSEYSSIAAKQGGPDWKYLQYLEENQGCAGWCYPAQQLWSVTPFKDSCSTTVATAFKYLVGPHAKEIQLIMLLVLLFSAVAMIFIGPHMRALGYDDW